MAFLRGITRRLFQGEPVEKRFHQRRCELYYEENGQAERARRQREGLTNSLGRVKEQSEKTHGDENDEKKPKRLLNGSGKGILF